MTVHSQANQRGFTLIELLIVMGILSGFLLKRYLSFRALCAKVIGLTAAQGAGFNIGREGPLVHLSACLATLLMRCPCFAVVESSPALSRSMLAAA